MTGIGMAAHSSTGNAYTGVWFFAAFWVVLVLGFGVHWLADRRRPGRGPHRTAELILLWVVVLGGVWTIFAGLGLADGHSYQSANSTGYTPSMYEWEVGWADIAIGFLGVACARKALRGRWMTAAVTVLAISFGGDAIGHIMQWSIHGNTAPVNVWAIPQDIVQAGLAVLLLLIYRRLEGSASSPPRQLAEAGSVNPP
jgi:uncharacterized membrane protein YsdA (DUF1294 family)